MSAFDPYHKWLGIPPKDQPPHHYRLLGIDLFETDAEVIEAAANRQMTYVQGAASGERVAQSQKLMKQITQARIVLLDQSKRAAYDAKLKQKLAAQDLKVAPSLERATAVPPPTAARPAVKPASPKSPPKQAAKLGGNRLDLGLQTPPPRAAGGSPQKKVQLGWQFPFFVVAVLLIVAAGIAMWRLLPGMLQPEETLLAGADPAPLETAKSAKPEDDAGRPGQGILPADRAPGEKDPQSPPTAESGPLKPDPAEPRRPGGGERPGQATTSDPAANPPFELPTASDVPQEDVSTEPPQLDPGGLGDGSTFPGKRPGGIDPLTGESLDDLVEKIDGTGERPAAGDLPPDPLADPRAGTAEAPHIERQPVPADALLQAARRQLSDEIARPPRGTEAAAAAELLDRVQAGQDDADRQFVLLDMAQEFAVDAPDVALALRIAQHRADRFEVDPLETQTALIYEFARGLSAKDHEAIRSVKQTSGRLLDRAIDQYRYGLAEQVLKSLKTLSKRLRDPGFDQLIGKYESDVAVGLRFLDVIRRALSVLETNADDPAANLTMGNFCAAGRGDWTAAAPYLMKTQSEALAAAASLELSVPTGAEAQYRVVEAWRAVAQDAEVDRRLAEAAGQRSKHWLLLAFNSAEGALKDRIQKELKEGRMLHENSVGMLFMRIPEGEFVMGSPATEEGRGSTFKYRKSVIAGADEQVVTVEVSETPHPVRITTPIFFGVYEVTQQQYTAVTKQKVGEWPGANQPVESIHWDKAMAFCSALTKKEQQNTPGIRYRLPTEAEWEYACRAGTQTPFAFGDELTDVHAAIQPERKPRPVGSYAPNAFGLFDMHGNVMEWVYDEFDPNLYDRLAARQQVAIDPKPRETIANRFKIARGGSYLDRSTACRSAARRVLPREALAGYIGFRVVLVPLQPQREGSAKR